MGVRRNPRLSDTIARGLAARGHQVTVYARTRAMQIDGWLLHPAAVGFEPGRRVARPATSSCACFPTYRTDWPTTVSASCRAFRITSGGTLRHSMSHICTPAEIPSAMPARATCASRPLSACPNEESAESERRRAAVAVRSRPGQAGRTAPPESLRSPTPNAGNWRGWVQPARVRGAKPVSARGVRAAASSRTLSRDLGSQGADRRLSGQADPARRLTCSCRRSRSFESR